MILAGDTERMINGSTKLNVEYVLRKEVAKPKGKRNKERSVLLLTYEILYTDKTVESYFIHSM